MKKHHYAPPLPLAAQSLKLYAKAALFVLAALMLAPTAAHAIPSPELVIGSVSSLGQVLAVVFASVSGLGAVLATKLGFKPKGKGVRYPVKLIAGLSLLACVLAVGNYWQWQNYKSEQQARLQSTLLRPTQGKSDSSLKEKAFLSQTSHPQAITTAEAARLLSSGDTKFYDIRETAENAMGALPGSKHIRFPDFRKSPPVQPGDKVVLFCHNGNRSSETCAALAEMGIDCRFIAGGIEKWIVEGRPFSDKDVKSLSDLRAIPQYEGKDTLLDTASFRKLVTEGQVQIIDTRYPGNFAAGHLPGAINVPIRAMTTDDLQSKIQTLAKVPTVAACYDRRSCFMGQVLGLELTQAGIPFAGRYTLPWEFFEAPAPKPHVAAWLAEQETGLWQRAINALSDALIWVHNRSHILLGALALAVLSRILVLPVALKSETDQLVMRANQAELDALKAKLAKDPTRKARAVQAFYKKHGLTPMRNLIALAFLPVMMLGVSSVEQAAGSIVQPFLWSKDLGATDPYYVSPILFTALAAVYLLWAVAKTKRQAILWCVLGLPALMYMVLPLSLAANLYLCFSLSLLLVQRAFVCGLFQNLRNPFERRLATGVVPLGQSDELPEAGNKALRLSDMKRAGLPVPMGVVLRNDFIESYQQMSFAEQAKTSTEIWKLAGACPVAVRSSASHEDGAEQSFAGVFDSVLDVTSVTMPKALDDVIASFSSERAASYQGEARGHGNILVQQMVDAEYAGVLFTQDPTAPGMAMVEWVSGCGEDLVSGRVTPDTERFGRYTQLQAGETALPIDFAKLLELGKRIETLFGTPQDIEWAYTKGEFFILQSRDITTLSIGSEEDQLRRSEWRNVLDRFAGAEPEQVVLEQDEMSEVLPRPTTLSFTLMTQLWAPGGALDQACRHLGLPYRLPEGNDAHLVRLFGKTYVDHSLKEQLALQLTGNKSRQLRKQLRPTQEKFQNATLPELHHKLSTWRAMDYRALPFDILLEKIEELRAEFVDGIYVEAEKINLLAAFANGEANQAASGDPALRNYLMQADLPNAPSALLSSCRGTVEEAQERALALMGHRAIFDYELSTPRYSEAPDLLFALLEPEAPTLAPSTPLQDLPEHLSECLSLAVAFQDLKEQAKHESLRILAELRRALLAFGTVTGLDHLVFSLSLDEVLGATESQFTALRETAQLRFDEDRVNRDLAPAETQLTLRDCELLSMGALANSDGQGLGGTCVAGSGSVSGRVFWVKDETAFGPSAFEGFEKGDILVCRMVNPAWLPQVQMAGAVLSEVGGWLSHMSIVAREKQILMLVGCSGLGTLEPGETITVSETGEIESSVVNIQKSALSA